MAWERRGNQLHYYTARRVDRRVVKEYVPTAVAAVAAALDAEARAAREAARADNARTRADIAALAAALDPLDALADAAYRAAMVAAGYHRHKGQWRKRRG